MENNLKCDSCGRFVSYNNIYIKNKGSYLFVPDSDVSYEEEIHRCETCTNKYGKPVSNQAGVFINVD